MNSKVVLLIAFVYCVSGLHGEINATGESKSTDASGVKTVTTERKDDLKSVDAELSASNDWNWKTEDGNEKKFEFLGSAVWPKKGFKYVFKDYTGVDFFVTYSAPGYVVVAQGVPNVNAPRSKRFIVLTKHLYADGESIKSGWYGCLGKRRVGERVLYVFREL